MRAIWIVFTMWAETVFSEAEAVCLAVALLAAIILLIVARKKSKKILWIAQFAIEGAALLWAGVMLYNSYMADDLLHFLYISIPALAAFGMMLIISGMSCALSGQ